MGLRTSLLMLVLVFGSPVGVSAQESPQDAIAQIREQVLYAQYREAVEGLEAYLARDDLDAAGRNAGLEVLATVQIARREQRAANETLQRLYARDPQHRLSESDPSPPVLSAFGRARENPPEMVEVILEHEPPFYDERVPPEIEVELGGEGADAVQEVRLRYRQGDGSSFSTIVMNLSGGVASARIPLQGDRDAYSVEYAVEATAPSGAILATAGSSGDPLSFEVPEAPSGSSPVLGVGSGDGEAVEDDEGGSLAWLWITLGVALVAGGVVTAVVLASNSGPDDGSLGNIELPLLNF
jgi:hypothetical protein